MFTARCRCPGTPRRPRRGSAPRAARGQSAASQDTGLDPTERSPGCRAFLHRSVRWICPRRPENRTVHLETTLDIHELRPSCRCDFRRWAAWASSFGVGGLYTVAFLVT